jgi:hypothetical protein
MVFFTAAEARKDKWSVMADLIYLKLGGFDATTTLNRSLEPSLDLSGGLKGFTLSDDLGPSGEGGLKLDTNADMKAWVVTLYGGYSIVQTEKAKLDLVAGVRYLDLEMDVREKTSALLELDLIRQDIEKARQSVRETSISGEVWDGLVGVRGTAVLSKDWYLSYLADIGTGDSDVTWQLFVGANRKFPWGDLMLGYRYLKWELGDDKLVDHLEVNGPIVGAKVWF